MDPSEEARRVSAFVESLQTSLSFDGATFFADRDKGRVLALLLDRVQRVENFVESCRAAVALVHRVIFPLNRQPRNIADLIRRFKDGSAVRSFVCQHLIGGAQAALVFVRVRYPDVDMAIVDDLPVTPDGRVDMTPHYASCRRAAIAIADLSMAETGRLHAAQE
jgi:hypothetical protein